MKDRAIYKSLKLVQKGEMKKRKLGLICLELLRMELIRQSDGNDPDRYELTIKGKIFLWDWENWKLSS